MTEEGAAMKPRGMPSSRNDSVDDGLEDDTCGRLRLSRLFFQRLPLDEFDEVFC